MADFFGASHSAIQNHHGLLPTIVVLQTDELKKCAEVFILVSNPGMD